MSEILPSPEFEDDVRRAMQVPDADPAFVRRLRAGLVSKPVKSKSRWTFGPVWALASVLVLALLVVAMPSVVAAIGRLFGYVPGVGLVENSGNLRMLAEPVSVQRGAVTLTITSVFVYSDRVELAYRVEGIDPANDGTNAPDSTTNPTAFCGGVNIGGAYNKDGDARLRLADGTLLERDYTGIYPKNAYAMTPVYKAAIPQDVTAMTMVLKCLPWARLGAEPENWEVPFNLVSVPAGTLVGEPVYEVPQPTPVDSASPTAQPSIEPTLAPSAAPSVPAPLNVSIGLDKVVPLGSGTIFYFSMNVEHPDPSLQSVVPGSVYMIDSLGQKIQLTSGPIYPVEHPVGSLFEYFSTVQPAAGPLTLVVENAVAYYAPGYVEPRQATPEEISFSFDAGANPQYGQIWVLDKEIEVAGYKLKVTSARAASFEDIRTTSFIDGSQGYDFGYQFGVEADPSVKIMVQMDILSDLCWISDPQPYSVPKGASLLYTELCRNGYPKGMVTVTLGELSVLVENSWQATWSPQ